MGNTRKLYQAAVCFTSALLIVLSMAIISPGDIKLEEGLSVAPSKCWAATKVHVNSLSVSNIPVQYYSGRAVRPKPEIRDGSTLLRNGKDYTLKYKNNAKRGTARITITGRGNYTGTRYVYFRIAPKTKISKAKVIIPNQGYTGKALKPTPTVILGGNVLTAGIDYSVKYKNNKKKGTATVTITGKGRYSGTKKGKFKIVTRTDLSKTWIDAIGDQTYTGGYLTPQPTITYRGAVLSAGVDYGISYNNNVNAGTASITVTGQNLYCGSRTVYFKINPLPLSKAGVSGLANQVYTGGAFTPRPVLMMGNRVLVEGADYSVTSYKNNVNAGTATVTMTGRNNYSGTKTAGFKITPASFSSAAVSAIPNQTWVGSALKPAVSVKLKGKTISSNDYTVSYSNNVEIGRATVTISGKGNFSGSITSGFDIVPPAISGLSISEDEETGAAWLGTTLSEFNKLFSYGDSLDVEFSSGYVLSGIPYYNGYYAKLGDPLVLSHSGVLPPRVSTNYGERLWDVAGLSEGDTATVRLAAHGAYSTVQNSLNITYSDNRADYPSDAAFANFRQVVGGKLSGNLYRSATPIFNWRKRAGYASSLAASVGIGCILDLSDSADAIREYVSSNHANGVDSSYFEELFDAGKVLPLNMNASYSTSEFREKIAAGLSQMAHRDGPYLVHCIEGKDRTGFTCLLLAALADASYDEMLADYMTTYANYCGITQSGTPEKYAAVKEACFDSMIGFLMTEANVDEGDYASAARKYLMESGMSAEDIDLLVSKLTSSDAADNNASSGQDRLRAGSVSPTTPITP